ncbi:MAG: MBL fold metallo-hydrolase, partial [Sphingobacteriales bacterium]
MQQITDQIYQINLGPVNVFVIEENDGLTLIDTGFKNSTDKIFKAIEKAGKDPKNIKQIILTHTHPDHAGSAAEIKRRLNIPILVHAEDAKLAENGVAGRLPHQPSPGFLNFILFNLFIKNSPNEIEAFTADQILNDNDVLPLLGGTQVIYTPGHSLGHICLLIKKENLLVAGDLCSNMMGIGYSTVYENREVGKKSIYKA